MKHPIVCVTDQQVPAGLGYYDGWGLAGGGGMNPQPLTLRFVVNVLQQCGEILVFLLRARPSLQISGDRAFSVLQVFNGGGGVGRRRTNKTCERRWSAKPSLKDFDRATPHHITDEPDHLSI
jgi:hypothetical protein